MMKFWKSNSKTNSGSRIVENLVDGVTSVKMIGEVTNYSARIIDGILTATFLGAESMAAYGLAVPVFILLSGIGGPIINGVNKVCGNSVGRGDLDTSNKVFTSSLVGGGILAAILSSLLMLFPRQISMLLSANGVAVSLQKLTMDYLRGLSIGVIPFVLIIVFMPFIQLNGDKAVLTFAVTSMSVLDVLFDLANLFVFKGGLFGMALASSLSYWAAFLIMLAYFLLKKGGLFRFDLRNWDFRLFLHTVYQGTPSILLKACNLVQSVGLNYIVIHMLPTEMLAVYSVINSIQLIAYTPGAGIGEGTLLVSSMMYGEEDRQALERVQREGLRLAVLINGIILFIGMVFARLIVSIYLSRNPELIPAAAIGLRLILLSTIPYSLQMMYRNYLQAVGHQAIVLWLTVSNELVLALGAALLMTAAFSETGFWLSFTLRDLLTLFLSSVFIYRNSLDKRIDAESILMLPPEFGANEEDRISCSLTTTEEVLKFSEEVRQFCLQKQENRRNAMILSLCVEEIGVNTVSFGMKNRKKQCEAMVYIKDNRWMLRFRDDCDAFDPVAYAESLGKKGNPEERFGLRLALYAAHEAVYVRSMKINNLRIQF